MEYQISCLSDEKVEIEKNIKNFDQKYNEELGDLITKILYYKKIIAKKRAEEYKNNIGKQNEYESAKTEFEDFSKSYQEIRRAHV